MRQRAKTKEGEGAQLRDEGQLSIQRAAVLVGLLSSRTRGLS